MTSALNERMLLAFVNLVLLRRTTRVQTGPECNYDCHWSRSQYHNVNKFRTKTIITSIITVRPSYKQLDKPEFAQRNVSRET